MKTAGIDACKAGWLLVSFDDGGEDFQMLRNEALLEDAFDAYDRIFLNLPVGLSDDTPLRACDRMLIEKLGPDSSKEVIAPPVRTVLSAPTYAEATVMSYDLTGEELPVKTWSLVPRIRIVDRLLEESEDRRQRIFESHPELLLMGLNGGRIYQNRHTKKGLQHRLNLINSVYAKADDINRDVKEAFRRNEVDEDVIINVLALATAARLSDGEKIRSLPDEPAVDSKGLKMAVYYV